MTARISATRDDDDSGSCELVAPQGRSGYQLAIEEATILVSGRVGAIIASDHQDVARCLELAAANSLSDSEAQTFLDLAYERALALVIRAQNTGMLNRFLELLQRHDGELNTSFAARRDLQPLIEVTPQITVNTAAPIINLTLPEQPAPLVTVENQIDLQQPDRVVTFARNFSGQIVEATISDESETEPEPETTT